MTRSVVCDDCGGLATQPCEYYQADRWDEDGHRATVDLCPDCVPEKIVDSLEEDA